MPRVNAKVREETRGQLLAAGAEHIARDGLERASVDAIAIAAGYAKGTFYNYFDSKEQLFGEVIAEAARRAVSHYARAKVRGTTRQQLLALAAADVDVLREQEAFTKVVIREVMSFRPKTYPLILAHLAPFLQKIEAVLSRGVVRGEVRGDRPIDQQTLIFVGTLALLYVQHWGSGGLRPSLDDVPHLAVDSFLDGAGVRSGARKR
ncbi:MAG TPA: TetR/AcrR family transcriptional regulator [Steroidobacteraceae bacterium]|nr:TetR/AcrR family transcriptional regulator [Steroidobacteraceae bacterium]